MSRCQNAENVKGIDAVDNVCFFVSLLVQTHTRAKFTVPVAYFHAKPIGASPVIIAFKMEKLSKFLYLQTQCKHTIHVGSSSNDLMQSMPKSIFHFMNMKNNPIHRQAHLKTTAFRLYMYMMLCINFRSRQSMDYTVQPQIRDLHKIQIGCTVIGLHPTKGIKCRLMDNPWIAQAM